MISRKALVALGCSSSSSCCSRALGSTSAPPDTDPVFATLTAPGIFHPGGPAELWQRKPSHEVVSRGQESWRSAGRADQVPQGKEALAGNVDEVRRAGSPRQSTEAQPPVPSASLKGTPESSAGLCSPSGQCPQIPHQADSAPKAALPWHCQTLGFLINSRTLHGHHSPAAHTDSPPPYKQVKEWQSGLLQGLDTNTKRDFG